VKLSSRGDYAIRAVLELAEAGDRAIVSAGDIEARAGVPRRYLTLLMRELQAKSIVRGVRGVHGGFTLGRPADQITVGQVIRVMEGPLAPIGCASLSIHIPCPTTRCQEEESCVMRAMWLDVRQAISDVVDNTTFADLVARRRAGTPTSTTDYTT
jgi:Rrf2 family protein